jgi:DNA primase
VSDRPYVSFAEVKQKVPIPDVLELLAIADGFKRKGDVVTGCCPLPEHQHGPSPNDQQFKINRKDGVWLWHCFGDCQRGGDVIELVKAMTDFDDAHVRFWFAEHFGDRLTLKKPKVVKKAEDSSQAVSSDEKGLEKEEAHDSAGWTSAPSQAKAVAAKLLPPLPKLKPLRFYLNLDSTVPYLRENRGLTEETINRFGLGLCSRGYLKGYVAIPVFSFPHAEHEKPVAYLGRWPGEDFDEDAGRPRYRWPQDFGKSHVVYGLDLALESPQNALSGPESPLIVLEGCFKVYHLFQAGYANTVAIFGSSLSDEQAALLVSTGRPIILMFDGNEAGYQGMRNAAAKLITHTFVSVLKLVEGTEPDDLSAKDLHALLG